ncbi:hypothetical protein K440DRAFT_88934 [Wilcoxina mikolae CBS 423.85]|nr:hypothetical protein K440DRAFT_88934 [Wilcoxina mikolae CBS 423.85]
MDMRSARSDRRIHVSRRCSLFSSLSTIQVSLFIFVFSISKVVGKPRALRLELGNPELDLRKKGPHYLFILSHCLRHCLRRLSRDSLYVGILYSAS